MGCAACVKDSHHVPFAVADPQFVAGNLHAESAFMQEAGYGNLRCPALNHRPEISAGRGPEFRSRSAT